LRYISGQLLAGARAGDCLSFREIGRAILTTEPCRSMLTGIGQFSLGRRVFNFLSGPFGVFTSFAEAWLAAKRTNPVAHEDPEEIKMQLRVSTSLRSSDYPVLYWLWKIGAEDLRIFDYGGNVGNLYYSYQPYLRQRRLVEWTVFDIPPVVEEGKRIAAKRHASGLTFVHTAADVSRRHVLLISGAFHYWEGSIREFIRQFAEAPEHVIVNRSPIHETLESFITVQRTPTCAFPCIVRNADDLISDFAAAGYVMEDHWRALELALTLPLFPDRSVAYYSGFYFRLQKSAMDNQTPAD
jgi:putative methyltransferase (TIGR04325 family)